MEGLQATSGAVVNALAAFFTLFGEEMILVLILGFLYWCWDKENGKQLGLLIVTGVVLNPLIKNIAVRRRPYFDHKGIKCLKPVDSGADIYDIAAQGYSFPSGHSMNAAIVYGGEARYKKTRVWTVIGIAAPLLVGISRVFVGVHYPTDVLVGWLAGFLVVLLFSWLQKKVKKRWLLHLVIFAVSAVGVFYCRTNDYYSALGLMAGYFLTVPFEERYVNFENAHRPLPCICRMLGGLVVYLGLNTLLKLPFPASVLETPGTLAYMIRFLRYTIVSFAALGLYPLLFNRFKIFSDKE